MTTKADEQRERARVLANDASLRELLQLGALELKGMANHELKIAKGR